MKLIKLLTKQNLSKKLRKHAGVIIIISNLSREVNVLTIFNNVSSIFDLLGSTKVEYSHES